nr:uncharacterized protein LOC119626707 [Chlorocebus sabaeus]
MRRPRAPGCRTRRLRPAHLSRRRGLARPNLQLRWRAGAGRKHRVHQSVPSPSAALASQMLQCAPAHAGTGAAASGPTAREQSWSADWDTQWKLGLHRRARAGLGGSCTARGPGGSGGPRTRECIFGRGQDLGWSLAFYGEEADWEGPSGEAFLLCHFSPAAPGAGNAGLHRGWGGGFTGGSEDSTVGSGPAGRPAQEPAGNCSGRSR